MSSDFVTLLFTVIYFDCICCPHNYTVTLTAKTKYSRNRRLQGSSQHGPLEVKSCKVWQFLTPALKKANRFYDHQTNAHSFTNKSVLGHALLWQHCHPLLSNCKNISGTCFNSLIKNIHQVWWCLDKLSLIYGKTLCQVSALVWNWWHPQLSHNNFTVVVQ